MIDRQGRARVVEGFLDEGSLSQLVATLGPKGEPLRQPINLGCVDDGGVGDGICDTIAEHHVLRCVELGP